MSEEFKPIETQEELDAIITKRLDRERRKIGEEYSDYAELKKAREEYEKTISALQGELAQAKETIGTHDTTVSELTEKVKGYEIREQRRKIALETGLSIELADRIQGEDEESMKADAENLAKVFNRPTPLASAEQTQVSSEEAAYRTMLKDLM